MDLERLPNETQEEYRKRYAREFARLKRARAREEQVAANGGVYKPRTRGKATKPPKDAGVSDEEWYALRQQEGESDYDWKRRVQIAAQKRHYYRNQERILADLKESRRQKRGDGPRKSRGKAKRPAKNSNFTDDQWATLQQREDESVEDWKRRYNRERQALFRSRMPEGQEAARRRELHAANPEKERERARKWRAANPESFKASQKKYFEAHRQERLAALKAWAEVNPERYAEVRQEWYDANAPKRNNYAAARRAAVGKATPRWVDRNEIEPIYAEAIATTADTGIAHHVDHIVPLRGKTPEGYKVSGLHVPWNLQVLPGVENVRKRNNLASHEDALDWSAHGHAS